MVQDTSVLVVGGGVGGLAAAVDLARQGARVTLLDKEQAAGGKLRRVSVGGREVDAGPTVLTMRWVFDELWARCGRSFDNDVRLHQPAVLARHFWPDGSSLDLFQDEARTADAIGRFASPADAKAYLAFSAHAARIFASVERPFLRSQRPTLGSMARLATTGELFALTRIDAFRTLWGALRGFFHDPRLVQLFGRYSTYVGSSALLAPATLALIAHVEREGVWLVEGGMYEITRGLVRLAQGLGVQLRVGERVEEILVKGGRAAGVRLASGDVLAADAVVCNGDPSALGLGLLGRDVRRASPPVAPARRSLSAVVVAAVGRPQGRDLVRHNVLFCSRYEDELNALFQARRVPDEPTVYACAQDRGAGGVAAEGGAERVLFVVNAPANGDTRWSDAEVMQCWARATGLMERCGLSWQVEAMRALSPSDFATLIPGSGGALYGAASHGPWSAFERPGARTSIPALYLAGGATHPGAGVPMAALSGGLAAEALLTDLASTRRSSAAATRGRTSTA